MKIEEAKKIRRAIGMCLCGHFETCSVCTRSEAQREIERDCAKLLKKAGCGTKFPHEMGQFGSCRLCNKNMVKPTPIKKKFDVARIKHLYDVRRKKEMSKSSEEAELAAEKDLAKLRYLVQRMLDCGDLTRDAYMAKYPDAINWYVETHDVIEKIRIAVTTLAQPQLVKVTPKELCAECFSDALESFSVLHSTALCRRCDKRVSVYRKPDES